MFEHYDFHVIIDYCHSVNSLENILKFAKGVKKSNGRIIAVLGPLGKKSNKKRGLIGKLADEYCDQVILTQVDSVDDDVNESCADIQKYIKNPVSVIIEDRHFAVEQAIEIATKDDIILLAGKGHETYQIIGNEKVPFSEKEIVLEAVKNNRYAFRYVS